MTERCAIGMRQEVLRVWDGTSRVEVRSRIENERPTRACPAVHGGIAPHENHRPTLGGDDDYPRSFRQKDDNQGKPIGRILEIVAALAGPGIVIGSYSARPLPLRPVKKTRPVPRFL